MKTDHNDDRFYNRMDTFSEIKISLEEGLKLFQKTYYSVPNKKYFDVV